MQLNKIVIPFLISAALCGLNAQPFTGRAYKTGIYVFCGNELPKHFSYIIERKAPAENDWHSIAELKSPVNEAECKACFMDLPQAILSQSTVSDATLQFVWHRIQASTVIDSLYAYGLDPRYQSMAGVAWFDKNITRVGNYLYRISKLSKTGSTTTVREVTISFPGKAYVGTVRPARFKPGGSSIDISYEVNDSVNTSGLKVFRSPFLLKKFIEINPAIMFTKQKNRIVAVVSDASVLTGLTYSYVAIPYDALGNLGIASDTLNVYNATKQADLGLITGFTVKPVTERKGVELNWTYKSNLAITSIEVYRSATYDGVYQKIVSLPANRTAYFDAVGLQPAISYFYYITINNGYGSSLPSARTPAILQGTKRNIFPPRNLTYKRKDRVVTLTFERMGRDTRSYYVYRADGYVAPLNQLSRMVLTTDSIVSYHDTLPLSVTPSVYSYAVASVNTSYNISPQSERVNVRYSGGMLPTPARVNAILYPHSVFVTWDNVSDMNAAVSGYRIFRRSMADEKEVEPERLIATTAYSINNYTDSMLVEGRHYYYRIQSLGMDSTDVSNPGMPAGILYPEVLPLQPGEVSAIAADTKILIKWSLPVGEQLSKIKIYRAELNKQATLLKELAVPAESFEDNTAKPETTYFYYLVTVNKAAKESHPTDAVSAKL
jgi:fibronectin type 3 domain-containing protein